MICSIWTLVAPYGLMAPSGASSVNGTSSEAPYTVAEELNTMRRTSCASITRSSRMVPATLFS
jgi:hypothetical protein